MYHKKSAKKLRERKSPRLYKRSTTYLYKQDYSVVPRVILPNVLTVVVLSMSVVRVQR